jgi:hypothetical protein
MSAPSKDVSMPAAEAALAAHQGIIAPWIKGAGSDGPEDKVVDLMTSLRHYCNANNIVFETCAEDSLTLYAEEVTGTEATHILLEDED